MTEYEIAVRCLGSRNTHLKLRERCRLALVQVKQNAQSLPVDYIQNVQLAIYRRQNAIAYKQRHFPHWDDLPCELTEKMRYPLSGHGMAQLNTMLGLFKMAEEAEEAIAHAAPIINPGEAEIDQMIQDYLAYRQGHKMGVSI